MPSQPAAFLSYARFNDLHDDGWVSQFCERLSAEVRVQLGEEFPIFQDRKDVAWGQSWPRRIDQALDAVTLLLVIITPGFFRSAACRAEVERFLARERELGRDDLILPVYYVSTPELDDPRRHADELARALRSRQFTDWRDLRFEPLTSPKARRAVAHLATRMRDTFWRPPANPPTRLYEVASSAAVQSESTEGASSDRWPAKTSPRAHMADSPAYEALSELSVNLPHRDDAEDLGVRTMPWDVYWNRLELIKSKLENVFRDGSYNPTVIVGITNGGAMYADLLVREIFETLPAVTLWADRRNPAGNFFDNQLNKAIVSGVRSLVAGGEGDLNILLVDDIIASETTVIKAVTFLGDQLPEAKLRFLPLFSRSHNFSGTIKRYLLWKDPVFDMSDDEAESLHSTGWPVLPYKKDIRSD
jgi:hypoxanthine phosphoribosyltransferase